VHDEKSHHLLNDRQIKGITALGQTLLAVPPLAVGGATAWQSMRAAEIVRSDALVLHQKI